MWEHITRATPHLITNTHSLNNARKLIAELAEPMVMLQHQIQSNIAHIRAQEGLLRSSTENKQQLARNLNIEVEDLESAPLDHPRTVCSAVSCTEVVKFQGQDKINYKTHCHRHCYLEDVGVNTVG